MEPANFVRQDIRVGFRPRQLDSVIAEVLARLLAGQRLNSLDAVRSAGTTRLAAVIFSLVDNYGWQVERQDIAVGCRDGRVAWVREYWLAPEVIAKSTATIPELWCSGVSQARKNRRTRVGQAHALAESANAARQLGLDLD